jgi:hypothetical protein
MGREMGAHEKSRRLIVVSGRPLRRMSRVALATLHPGQIAELEAEDMRRPYPAGV